MSLKSLCVLNCIEDAQLFLEEFSGEYDEWLTVSTHGSVNDFLKTKKLQCLELSSLMTHEFIQESYWEADDFLGCQMADSQPYTYGDSFVVAQASLDVARVTPASTSSTT